MKVCAIVISALIIIVLVIWLYCYADVSYRASRTFDVHVENIDITYDSATIALGERLSRTRACRECHGDDLSGNTLLDDALVGTFVTKNITRGKGGLPADFSVNDWVLAMKHGLDRNQKPLYLMPSHELSQLAESDMAALIAYCSQVPPVDTEPREFRVGPLGYVLAEFDLISLFPAEFTDHTAPLAKSVKPEVSAAYGKYLATICVSCHGPKLKGGPSPVPGGTYVADITSTGNPGKWSHEQFITALQTGITPEGKHLNPTEMPWTITKNYTKDELTALHMYLLTLR